MTGPWMGRVLGVTAAAAIVALVAHELVARPVAPVLVGLAIAEAVLVVRLLLLLLVVGPPSDPAGTGVASGAAMLVEARSSIAVICTAETLPAVRVAVSAAVSASLSPALAAAAGPLASLSSTLAAYVAGRSRQVAGVCEYR